MAKVANNHTQVYLDFSKFTLTPNWNFMFVLNMPLNTSIIDVELYFKEYRTTYSKKFDFNFNHKFDKYIWTEKIMLDGFINQK